MHKLSFRDVSDVKQVNCGKRSKYVGRRCRRDEIAFINNGPELAVYCSPRILLRAQEPSLPAMGGEVARYMSGAVAALYGTLDQLSRLPRPVTHFPIKLVAVKAIININYRCQLNST